ncbi:polysaccharide deacetylase family protein [Tardiphaga sp. P9-11]|jgi:peptidoglycan/xylan/chitin deacetylase (PgdA/CDA1 family)|uniref:polysaccharide deacetylase family protein n=1 Tax=Tardiphaga sp. P9-11 TaxID=2024614 RepID=UPI0011F2CFD5|nr:polysaccharide deacetylase family protein [Tardiphaga sp. P9-11]KAA0078678.1 polysaccharide deacetylase family protein [Tardiphaga sp. P9-11]
MRKLPFLIVAGSFTAVVAAGAGAWHFFGPAAAQTAAKAKSDKGELTTASIDTRASKPGASAEPAPRVQAVATAPIAAPTPPPAVEKRPTIAKPVCNNPNALGVSRTVQIDTTGGPGLGMSQYRDYDFLQPGEVVLTFDDGPWPVTTPAVLAALSAQCVQAVFFPIGKHATWHPAVLKQVIAAGHSVGTHTWSHQNLASKTPQEARDEIERGISAITLMAGQPLSPFFRFPQLRQNADLKAYLAERNIAAFSIDIDSEDFRIHNAGKLVASVMEKLKKKGKGIILMHDLHKWSAAAVPDLLAQLKAGGYKVVHIRAKDTLPTIASYDAAIAAELQPVKTSNARPISNVIQTVD